MKNKHTKGKRRLIQSFQGIIVYDHDKKRFWRRKEIIELAQAFWVDAEMENKPIVEDLAWIFREEFDIYDDLKDKEVIGYWDSGGTWEILEAPYNYGLGIIEENSQKRLMKLLKGDA